MAQIVAHEELVLRLDECHRRLTWLKNLPQALGSDVSETLPKGLVPQATTMVVSAGDVGVASQSCCKFAGGSVSGGGQSMRRSPPRGFLGGASLSSLGGATVCAAGR